MYKWFETQTHDLLAINKTRILTWLEIIQYSIIVFVVVVVVIQVIDWIFVHPIITSTQDYSRQKEIDKWKQKPSWSIFLLLGVRLTFLCFVYYYILKLIHTIPSLSNLIDNEFSIHQTFDYVIDIVFLVTIINLSDFVGIPMETFRDRLSRD